MSNQEVIKIEKVSKYYNSKKVLDNVSFQVKKGTIHGFIGPNGAGKTTTLKSLMRLVLPTSGQLLIEGKLVADDPTFNENLGFVEAEPKFSDETVERFLISCGELRDISKEEVLNKLGNSPLNKFRYQECRSLSTGWKKFLQLFILSLYQPKILLLDEPFNGLDPTFRAILSDNLKKIRNEGRTIILSTHILSDIQVLANNVTMIKNGKIVYDGEITPDIEQTYREYFIEKEKAEKYFEI